MDFCKNLMTDARNGGKLTKFAFESLLEKEPIAFRITCK